MRWASYDRGADKLEAAISTSILMASERFPSPRSFVPASFLSCSRPGMALPALREVQGASHFDKAVHPKRTGKRPSPDFALAFALQPPSGLINYFVEACVGAKARFVTKIAASARFRWSIKTWPATTITAANKRTSIIVNISSSIARHPNRHTSMPAERCLFRPPLVSLPMRSTMRSWVISQQRVGDHGCERPSRPVGKQSRGT